MRKFGIGVAACLIALGFAWPQTANARSRGGNSHLIGGGLQLSMFQLQGEAEIELEAQTNQGDKITLKSDSVDMESDGTVGFFLVYQYIAPKGYFFGGELVLHTYKGKLKGDLKKDDIEYEVDADYELSSTRFGGVGGYYFQPGPLRPYVMGGLGMNMNELDVEDVEEDNATAFSFSAGGGVDYFGGGGFVGGGGARIDLYFSEEYEIDGGVGDFTVTPKRIPFIFFGKIGYNFG
ncbi:hypothetical protein K8I61_00270 [bacterium]|nr:hypothetical protein [bacterium]